MTPDAPLRAALAAWGLPPATAKVTLHLKDGGLLAADAVVYQARRPVATWRWTPGAGWAPEGPAG